MSVLAALPGEVVGKRVIQVLNAIELVGANQAETIDVDDRNQAGGVFRVDLRDGQTELAAPITRALGILGAAQEYATRAGEGG